jgi:hypothetical protein
VNGIRDIVLMCFTWNACVCFCPSSAPGADEAFKGNACKPASLRACSFLPACLPACLHNVELYEQPFGMLHASIRCRPTAQSAVVIQRVRVEMLGSHKQRMVGGSDSVLLISNPVFCIRARNSQRLGRRTPA